jgi:hypothetical protein
MDWQPVGIVVSGALSVAAITAAVLGQRRADGLAQDAAASARRSADAADRAALALEHLASDRGPQWKLEHLQGGAYTLTNVGPATARRVHINTGDLRVVDGQLDFEQIGSGSAVKFIAVRTLGSHEDTVTVEWSPDGEPNQRKTWSRPLPGNPTR